MESISGANFLLAIYVNANYANGIEILLTASITVRDFSYEADSGMISRNLLLRDG
jgi:hypothetical protein